MQTIGKYLYLRNPNLNPFQLLLVSQMICAIIFSAIMNVNVKYYMYECIDRKVMPLFFTRIGCNILIMISVYTAIKGLPPVYVALTSNFGPLLTALFSFILFKKSISKLDIMVLIISFIGVVVLIYGTPDHVVAEIEVQTNEKATNEISMFISISAMLAIPFLSCAMALIMRQIRQMSEITISGYSSYLTVICLGTINLFSNNNQVAFYTNFKSLDWILICSFGALASLM